MEPFCIPSSTFLSPPSQRSVRASCASAGYRTTASCAHMRCGIRSASASRPAAHTSTNSATQATWALSRAAVYVPLRHIAPLGGSRTVTTLGLDEEPAIRGRGEAQVHGEEPVCNKDGRVRGIRDTGRIEEIHVVPVTGSAANPYIQDEISGLVKHRNITGLSDSFSQDHAY
ncbi:hypothetical protein AcV7_003593 [Taiwanofungus camphoratus]|nr:hypothetical protein AcV7_003593 [Antrodia cinnamomea]